jgi:hypothetical protein
LQIIRYELNCLEEKFQVHLERVESTGGQRRIKPTGLRYIDIHLLQLTASFDVLYYSQTQRVALQNSYFLK